MARVFPVCSAADDGIAAEYAPRLADGHIVKSEMNAVCANLANKFHAVIDDEGCAITVAKPAHLFPNREEVLVGSLFHAQLNPFDAAVQGKADAIEISVSISIM